MSLLMAGLQETQMWAVYQMGMGNKMPASVTKEDLTSIITFLFKQLDWIDDKESSSQLLSSCKPVIVETKIQSQNSDQSNYHSLEQTADVKRPSEENFDVTIDNKQVIFNDYIENSTSVNENDECMDLCETLYNSKQCPEADASQDVRNSIEDANKLMFSCALCGEKFSKENYLSAHIWMRHAKQKHQENSIDLKKHEKAGEDPFSCSQCEYKCSTLRHLKTHKRIHTGDKPFSCSQCNYNGSTSSTMKNHERIHTGDKPYKCSKCDSTFTRAGSLRRHESKCHGKSRKQTMSIATSSFLQEIKTEPI